MYTQLMNVTLYIRNEDEAKWKAIENKSEWLHYHLSNESLMSQVTTYPVGETKVPGGTVFVPKPPDPELGYPCCQQKRPCKHWSFDGATSTWVNELTGKTKEVVV